VPAFDTAEFVIEAGPDLIGGIRLLNQLFARERSTLDYSFNAGISTGMMRSIKVVETGSFGIPADRQ
jgi:hypothetical protein